ncbi:MAG: hypothetical protein NT126_08790 [Bacteroidetes bacterium]|nr:hypothetical protein [Bacteroidota bacterium]
MEKIRINYFGIGCRLVKGRFDEPVWEKFHLAAQRIRTPLHEAFFDTSFFSANHVSEFKSWQELGNVFHVSGLMNHYQSLVEIRINNKQKKKIIFRELLNENVLFPLYRSSVLKEENDSRPGKSLIIVEKEIGTIAGFEFETGKFSLEQLQFFLKQVKVNEELQFTVLSGIEYDGRKLMSKKSDTLVKERFALIG